MFDPVDPRQSFPDLERGILQYWKEEDTFRRSIRGRAGGTVFSFYDGPPFATGLPHYGHLIGGTIKDVIPRYRTMRGDMVERRFGWDCHGLPIENLIEKEKGITNKRQIEEMGVGTFNALCRGSVQRYTKEWRTTVERMGRWVDMDHDYKTMDPTYMESIWWVFSQVYAKGLMYEGFKPMHVCPRCVTPLSNFEVTQGYKDVHDQSVTAMFKLKESEDAEESEESKEVFFLAWTTTPWTLPGNLFLAVGPKISYVNVACEGKIYIVAKELVESVFKGKEHEVTGKAFKGSALVGKRYEPLFPYYAAQYDDTAFRVVDGDFVTTEDGTGIVHIATGFGDDDFQVAKRLNMAPLQHVTMDGHFKAEVTDFADEEVKPKDDPTITDKKVAEWLKKHHVLFATASYTHAYPHCWRCDSPLLNYATSSWFVAVEKIKEKMLKNAKKTTWIPNHLRDGRFGKWLEGARDWAISRNRYWGTPLPVWRDEGNGTVEVVGSRQELMDRCRSRFSRITVLRHAQSEYNVQQRYEGTPPGSPLSALGKKQAKATAQRLRATNVDVIYCSPLERTLQTAQSIADETGAKVIVDDRLIEVQFGEYEGKQYDFFSDPDFLKERRVAQASHPTPESFYHLPGMEDAASVYARIASFFTEMLPRHRSDHVVVVTHADPLLHVRRFFTKEPHQKLAEQPMAQHADPHTFFWDYDRDAEMDLHKESVDTIQWNGAKSDQSIALTIVRHGETDLNLKKIIQGCKEDPPLNETGRAQALEAAKKLKGQTFDVFLCSSLRRARETAEIIAKEIGTPVDESWETLRERDLGEWTGRQMEEVMREFPPAFESMRPAMHQYAPANGESLSQFINRGHDVVEMLRAKYAGKRVLVVGHGGFTQALRMAIENTSYREAAMFERQMKNAEMLTLDVHPAVRRIPEVLDCWFESGSMPYAQSHYPFEDLGIGTEDLGQTSSSNVPSPKSPSLPHGFPADFIAEGVDQTRLWFYTLMVLSTILFDDTPYRNVVVNGIVLADDGRKMSKRLKNYPDPTDVINKYGADALRFALMSSPAVRAEDLRFSERVVEESLRSVVLPLWNAYSFFVTYANAAEFQPVARAHVSDHPLDCAMRAMTQDLVNRMTEQLDAYDLSATCSELHDTIDALTNWYIRLSRRRFAGKGSMDAEEAYAEQHEGDRQDALTTLYDVLLTFCQLLAPFCPFVTESIYLNLVPEKHGSIHLTRWPEPRRLAKKEEALLQKTRLLRGIVSLSLKVRAERKIKVRQPLQSLAVAVPAHVLQEAGFTDGDLDLLRQEVNVKEIAFAEDPKSLADVIAQVDARLVGPRMGAAVQAVIAAGKRGEFTVRDDGAVLIDDVVLSPEEAKIVYRAKEGGDVAADRGIVVRLDTRVTDVLKAEGDLRAIIRAVQRLRKDAGLAISDTITLAIDGADELFATYGERIAQETNAVFGKSDGESYALELDDRTVQIRFTHS